MQDGCCTDTAACSSYPAPRHSKHTHLRFVHPRPLLCVPLLPGLLRHVLLLAGPGPPPLQLHLLRCRCGTECLPSLALLLAAARLLRPVIGALRCGRPDAKLRRLPSLQLTHKSYK